MRKRVLIGLLTLCLLMAGGTMAEEASFRVGAEEPRVYRVGTAEPFGEDEEVLDFYVCPLMGADCMVLTVPGHAMLIDMGKNTSWPIIRGVLEELGLSHFDLAFNTHPHSDHLGSMKELAQAYTFDGFMTAFPFNYKGKSIIQMSGLGYVRKANIPITQVEDGYSFTLGNAKMTVIRCPRYKINCNMYSAMLRVDYGECSLLLGADVTGVAQRDLAETHQNLRADVLKWPHHGLNACMLEFLDAVKPEYAVLTHGYVNTKRTQKQMQEYGIDYDFATWGTIHLSTNGRYWLVDQELTEDGKVYQMKYRP